MNETVTVDEAISKGHRMVNYPVIGIIVGTIALTFYLVNQKYVPLAGLPFGIVIAIVLGWLWWSFKITTWRIWAFDNVRNVHELKKRAIREKLIWPDNSFFVKTEIRSKSENDKLNSIANKFLLEDVFQDDLTVANETIIYYSRGQNFAEMTVMLICLGLGIYFILTTDNYIFGSILSILGIYYGYNEYKEATNTIPQIIINEKGIETINTEFHSWNCIENEEVISESSGKHTYFYLTYEHPDGVEHLQIDDYDTDQKSLNNLLILYRGRSKKKH